MKARLHPTTAMQKAIDAYAEAKHPKQCAGGRHEGAQRYCHPRRLKE